MACLVLAVGAAVLGLLLGVGLAAARELLDTSISSHDDVEGVTEAPILGNIQIDNRAVDEHPSTALKAATPWSEASGCCAPTCSTSRSTTTSGPSS